MEIKITDAGRIAEGYLDERRDCAVRALAAAADIPYYQAHEIFKWGGRRRRCASYRTLLTLTDIGLRGIFNSMSLATFLKLNPKGDFFVVKRGHAFAVKDGVIFDDSKLGGRVQVRWYMDVKKDLTR